MNTLIIGSGAREHALARAIKKSKLKNKLYCFASNINPGIKAITESFEVGNINDSVAVINFAKSHSINIAIIGPEAPLAHGVTDALQNIGVGCVGPTKALAQLETSKGFTRNLMKKYSVPGCPKYSTFTNMESVSSLLGELGDHYVVKFDGLMGGKGVKVAGDHLSSHADAITYCEEIINNNGKFVIEEKLIGEEFSLMSFCDGDNLIHMPPVQDHKRAYENDTGPNTGGMGSYNDVNQTLPFLNNSDIALAQDINAKVAQALKTEFGVGYKGVIYGGFIATADGVKVIEYNARFGDPEAMNVLSLVESDFLELCQAIVSGGLNNYKIQFSNKATVCKYAVPEGYPDKPVKNLPIDVSSCDEPNNLYYASVNINNGVLVEAGSRTIAVVGIANSLQEAEQIAEKEISKIEGPLFHRKDIGTAQLVQKRVDHMKSLRSQK